MSLFARDVVPSTVVNDQDQGAIVTIAAAFGLVTIIIFVNIRLLIRWPWQSLFGLDDAAAAVASAFGVIQTIVVLSEVLAGLGKKNALLTQQSALHVQKMIYASDLLYVWDLYCSKLAVCILIKRLCISRQHLRFATVLTYLCMGLGVVSMFVIGLRQRTSQPWNGEPATGRTTLHRWIAVEAFACLIDVAIAIFPIALVWDLQMKQEKKVWVILGFAARLPTIPLAVMRLISLSRSLTSTEQVFDHATSEVFTQAELCYSVISATIPCLRISMQSVNTGLLGMTTFDESTTDRSNPTYFTSRSGKYGGAKSSNKQKGKMNKANVMNTNRTVSIELQDRAMWGENSTNAVAGSDKHSVASDSSERAIMVQQTINVHYDEPSR